MFARRIGKPGFVGLSSALLLAAAIAGCGGQPTDSSDASVVAADADVNVASKSRLLRRPVRPAPLVRQPTAAAARRRQPRRRPPVAPRAGERSRGRSSSTGARHRPKVLQEKGKAAKDPNVCAVDAPIVSERLVIDAATKGVKNVLVYFPRPTAVNEDAKKALAAKSVTFDQKKCVFEPHVLGMMVGETVTLKSSDPVNHNVNVKLKTVALQSTLSSLSQPQNYLARRLRAHSRRRSSAIFTPG